MIYSLYQYIKKKKKKELDERNQSISGRFNRKDPLIEIENNMTPRNNRKHMAGMHDHFHIDDHLETTSL